MASPIPTGSVRIPQPSRWNDFGERAVKSAFVPEIGCLSPDDPSIGRLLTVECFGFAMDDRPVFFDGDLGEKGFGAIFARSGAYRAHLVVVLSVGVVGWSYGRNFGTTGTRKVGQNWTLQKWP
jgi:hypothetical protein